jgi:hypothetical protein
MSGPDNISDYEKDFRQRLLGYHLNSSRDESGKTETGKSGNIESKGRQ